MKMARPREEIEAVALVEYLRRRGIIIAHIPNGGARNAKEGASLKRQGVLAGMPDYLVLSHRLPSGNLIWIELKNRDGGRVSDKQKWIHEKLRSLGDVVIIGHGARDAVDKLLKFVVPSSITGALP